jgi:predicted  nucleic acid-binding Zn-ribbon protein
MRYAVVCEIVAGCPKCGHEKAWWIVDKTQDCTLLGHAFYDLDEAESICATLNDAYKEALAEQRKETSQVEEIVPLTPEERKDLELYSKHTGFDGAQWQRADLIKRTLDYIKSLETKLRRLEEDELGAKRL